MSMDLSDIEDPFDPDFHKAISSKKKKAVLYHGTSTRWFWDIVNNGFVFSPDRKNFDNTSPGVFFSFDAGRTDLYAHRASKNHGGEEIMFVAELPVSMLERDIDDKDTWDKDAKVQTMVRNTVPPKFITGVIYPISYGNLSGGIPPEIPIRKFIERVNKGKVPAIPPESEEKKRRFQRATPDDIEMVVAKMLVDLVQYTNLSHWLLDNYNLFLQKIVSALHGMKWAEYSGWRVAQWLQFLERVLGDKIDPDYYDYSEFDRPTWQLLSKYRDDGGFKAYRLGKKP